MDAVPVFVNPQAGTAAAVLELVEGDPRCALRPVEPAALARDLEEAMRAGVRSLVVAGGDGTLATAARVLAGGDTILGIIPAGTLNHFASDHGLPLDPAAALEVALCGAPVRVDLGSVGGRPFLNTSAVGAYVAYVKLRRRLEGRLGYALASLAAAVKVFFRLRSLVVEVEVDGAVRRHETPLVFIGVGERELRPPKLGGRDPAGRRGLHLLIVRRTSRLRLLGMALRTLLRGVRPWAGAAEVESLVVDRCRVTLPRAHNLIALDGELVSLEGPLEYVHQPAALTVRFAESSDSRDPAGSA